MAAGEDEAEAVVLERLFVVRLAVALTCVELLGDPAERRVEAGAPAQAVDRLEAAGGDQLGARMVGHAVPGPALDRGRERVVHRLLGQVEIAEQADEGGQHAARLGAVDGVHHLPRPAARAVAQPNTMTGRTSTLPSRAEGILAATWMASFRSLASMR